MTDTPKKTGPSQLLAELERITGLLADPQGDNTAGRLDTLKYGVLPNLLRSEVGTIIKALRAYCGEPEPEKAPVEDDSQMALL